MVWAASPHGLRLQQSWRLPLRSTGRPALTAANQVLAMGDQPSCNWQVSRGMQLTPAWWRNQWQVMQTLRLDRCSGGRTGRRAHPAFIKLARDHPPSASQEHFAQAVKGTT